MFTTYFECFLLPLFGEEMCGWMLECIGGLMEKWLNVWKDGRVVEWLDA